MKRLSPGRRAHLLRITGRAAEAVRRERESRFRRAMFEGIQILRSSLVPVGEAWLVSGGAKALINPRTPLTVWALSRITVVRNLGGIHV